MKMLCLISDEINLLYQKGELVQNYYNPENIYSEIHFPIFTDCTIPVLALKKACGNAKLKIHRLNFSRLRQKICMVYPELIPRRVTFYLSKLIYSNCIEIIRCYGHRANLVLGQKLKDQSQIKTRLICSVHINPDLDILNKGKNPLRRLALKIIDFNETLALQKCDLVIGVYKSIVPYFKKRKIKSFKIIYNSVRIE